MLPKMVILLMSFDNDYFIRNRDVIRKNLDAKWFAQKLIHEGVTYEQVLLSHCRSGTYVSTNCDETFCANCWKRGRVNDQLELYM